MIALIEKYVKFVIASPEGVAISFYKQEIASSVATTSSQ
jgi:hypothetical protein